MINPIFGGVSIARFGTEGMKRDLLPMLISGDMNFCMALTEPDSGTNTLELRTFAAADGDGFRLNGQKIWITGVANSQKMLVIARTRKVEEVKRKTEGITMFLIDTDRNGVSHTTIDKLGTNIPKPEQRTARYAEQFVKGEVVKWDTVARNAHLPKQ